MGHCFFFFFVPGMEGFLTLGGGRGEGVTSFGRGRRGGRAPACIADLGGFATVKMSRVDVDPSVGFGGEKRAELKSRRSHSPSPPPLRRCDA